MLEKIFLVDLGISHTKGYTDILSEENSHRFLTDSGPKTEEQVLQKIKHYQETKNRGSSRYWAIEGEDRSFRGFLALHDLDQAGVSVSFGVHPDYRRRGIGTAAIKIIRDWEGIQNKTLHFATHLDNRASFLLLKNMNIPYQGIVQTKFGKRHVFTYKKTAE